MCLAVPAKVVEIEESTAKVDYGGITRKISTALVDVEIGDYVIVHAGFAIEKIDEQEAKKTIELWNEITNI